MGALEDRVALITGAGAGIGRGIARRYAAEGAAIVVAERDAATGKQCVADLARDFGAQAELIATDVGVKEQVLAAVELAAARFGRLDVLVNNAWGGGQIGRLEKKPDALMEHGFRVGLMSAFWAMQAAFPHMKAQGWGRIVNLCSLNGVNAHMGTAEYNFAKEGLRALSRTAAREWAQYGICANVICPAAATTAYEAFFRANPETAQAMAAANPMGRMGDPERDIAGVALFLASEDCRYLTGNTLFVDGGAHINGVAWAPELPE
jgi:NAD(P)-dependent dehydrogenase (short-subunit alcohol dehydrogenase family)